MKVNKYVMGIYKGQIEVGSNSIIGMLLKGDLEGAGRQTAEMQKDLDELCATPPEQPSESKGEGGGSENFYSALENRQR